MNPEFRGKHAVKRAGRAAALDMTGHDAPGFHSDRLLQQLCNICARRKMLLSAAGFALLFLQFCLFLVHCAFRNGNNRKTFVILGTAFDNFRHLIDRVGNFRNQDHVRTAGHTGIQSQPSCFISHYFDHHNPAMACSS